MKDTPVVLVDYRHEMSLNETSFFEFDKSNFSLFANV